MTNTKKLNLITEENSELLKITKEQFATEKSKATVSRCLVQQENPEFINIKNIQEIPQSYTEIPQGYVNNVAHRGNYSEEEMDQTLEDGTKKMLHLELDFGKVCRLSCPHCFKNNKELIKANKKELTQEEIKSTILELKKLGLKTIKICGAGEPFDNKEFLPFLQFLHDNGLNVSVFTKGYILGSDKYTKQLNGDYGIQTAEDLAKKLKELDVSILLSVNSFDVEMQKKYSGAEKWKDYVTLRDKALVNMINAGLNEFVPGQPTRLAVIMAPMKPENLDEVIQIYAWARMRNIYPLGCPANESGLGNQENERIKIEYANYLENLIDVYVEINLWNIANGVTTLKQLEKEGISLYPGCHPCTQSRIGGYLNLYGELLSCPGHNPDRKELKISSDIMQESSLKEMWKQSQNYSRTGFNQKCIARDGSTLTVDFYDKIMEKVKRKFGK